MLNILFACMYALVLLWCLKLMDQYTCGRTAPFHVFRIVWQKVSPSAVMSRAWSDNPPRQFGLDIFGLDVIGGMKSDLGFSVHVFYVEALRYHLWPIKRKKSISIFGVTHKWDWKGEIVPPIESVAQ